MRIFSRIIALHPFCILPSQPERPYQLIRLPGLHDGLLALTGACYGRLGKTAAAERTLHEALETLGPKRTRRRAEALVDLARVRARQQNAEEAIGLAGEALEIAVETGSTAGIQRVRRFRPDLARWNGTRAAMALDEQLTDAI